MANKPLLDLDTLIERPTIRVDGKTYELRSPDELSIFDSQYYSAKGREIEKLAAAGDAIDELTALIEKLAGQIILGMPETVFNALSQAHKLSIVEVFTGLLLRRRMRVAGAIADSLIADRKSAPIGEKSSLGSSVSTEALRAGGSTKHRLVS
ncbi:MAG: hypothetical protein ABJG86_09715 [Nitratireductor sp.]